MSVLGVGMGIAFFIATAACAVEDGDVKALVSESLHTYNQFEKVMTEMKAATSDLDEQHHQVSRKIGWFKQPAFDDERIRGINSNITFYRNQISKFEALIEVSKITGPKERAELADKYEADRKRLLAEELQASKPFRKRIDKLKDEVKDEEAVFDKNMKPYCLSPATGYPAVASTTASAQYYNGFLTYSWLDKNGKQLAWAHIILNDRPAIKDNAEMLDRTYYLSAHWPNSITIWAGNFRVNFATVKPEWQGRERIAGLLKDFVHLEGLAKIDATRNNSSLNALAMGSLASSKRYGVIRRESSATTEPLRADRGKAKALIRRLKSPPADSEQLKKDRYLIDLYKKELKSSQACLEIGRVTDPNEREARIFKLEAEKKRLYAQKQKIARPYGDKTKELRRGVKEKESPLNKAIKRYLLTGADAYPGTSEISTKTIFYMGRISCSWKDADGNKLCSAQLNLRRQPAIPKDAQMLDNAYYISDSGTNFISVWAGNFQVYFAIKKSQWQGKEKVAEVLKQFIDLAGLAKIN